MTVKAALKHESRCYLKDTPKGWRRAGAKSHYQYMRELTRPGWLRESKQAVVTGRVLVLWLLKHLYTVIPLY